MSKVWKVFTTADETRHFKQSEHWTFDHDSSNFYVFQNRKLNIRYFVPMASSVIEEFEEVQPIDK